MQSILLPALIALIGFTFLLAGLVKGVVGLGLPTVAMGLLGLAMPPAQAAALISRAWTRTERRWCRPGFVVHGIHRRTRGEPGDE
jgi:hypothetical protein